LAAETGRKNVYRVQWDDGSEASEVQLGRGHGVEIVAVPADGLRHYGFAAPEALAIALDRDPTILFLAALRDTDRGLNARQIIEIVASVLPGTDVAAAWQAARDRFAEHASVTTSATKPPRYRWSGPREVAILPPLRRPGLEDSKNVATPAREGLGAVPTELPEGAGNALAAAAVERAVEPLLDDTTADGPEASASHATSERALSEVVKTARRVLKGDGAPGDLDKLAADERSSEFAARFVAAVALDKLDPRLAAQLASTPLATASALERVPDDVLQAGFARLGNGFLPVVAALPRESRVHELETFPTALGTESTVALLERARDELKSSRSRATGKGTGLESAYARLVRRAGTEGFVPTESALASLTALDRTRLDGETAGASLDWLTRCLKAGGLEGWNRLAAHELTSIEIMARAVPLTRDGPRTALLLEVYRIAGREVAEPRWWRDVSWDDLAASATGLLSRVLGQPEVLAAIVRPLGSEAMAAATTRARLFTVLGAPPIVVDSLAASEVANSIANVGKRDKSLSEWIGLLADESGRARLRETVDRATSERDLARNAERDAEARTAAANDRVQRLERDLRAAASATTGLRDSQIRQARIDAMRALADLAAFVGGALDSQPSERIRARVTAILGRQGVQPLGSPGVVEMFDPDRHDVVGAPAVAGASVVVRRAGYIWKTPDEAIVLARAIVEARLEDA